METKHYSTTYARVKRIVDSFYIGKLLQFFVIDENRFIAETSKGVFGFVRLDEQEGLRLRGDDKLAKVINRVFNSKHGKIITINTRSSFGDASINVPEMHKYDPYYSHKYDSFYYCLEL